MVRGAGVIRRALTPEPDIMTGRLRRSTRKTQRRPILLPLLREDLTSPSRSDVVWSISKVKRRRRNVRDMLQQVSKRPRKITSMPGGVRTRPRKLKGKIRKVIIVVLPNISRKYMDIRVGQ